MRIGLASIFSFRPHVEHLIYLARLMEQQGHSVAGFTCDAGVTHCYGRLLRRRSRLRECSACILGGVRSYPLAEVRAVDAGSEVPMEPGLIRRLTLSSAATIERTETAEDLNSPEVAAVLGALERPIRVMYGSAQRWIRDEGIEGVLLFNGRMDMTAAVRAACDSLGVPFVTVERAWFGHGLMLVPNQDCLGLVDVRRMSREYGDVHLSEVQAARAGRIAAQRFRAQNRLEWRLYNPDALQAGWPNSAPRGERVLILPSSRNEFEAHPDYACDWPDYTLAIDKVLRHLEIPPQHCVLRCHPNWAQRIGANTGWRSSAHYGAWARRTGITLIESAERLSTYDLIEAADYVIVNGSSAGVEAGLRGKRVVSVGCATYDHADFVVPVLRERDLAALDSLSHHSPLDTMRAALRYVYTHGWRFTQYVDFVRGITTAEYRYRDGADPRRLERILRSGRLEADDERCHRSAEHEDAILGRLAEADWAALAGGDDEVESPARSFRVPRRRGLRWLDRARNLLPRGDL